jgi:hypothetical protein
MITKFLFVRMSVPKQVAFMKKRGIMLGTRLKDGRQVYTYMFQNLFAEILYKDDNPSNTAERFVMIPGLDKLNDRLEKEIRSNRIR